MTKSIADYEAEARALILPGFSEADALRLGKILLVAAEARSLPVVINIRSPSRIYFHASLAGSTPLNDQWARRKSNTCLMFHESSLLVGLRHRAKGRTLSDHGLSPLDHADHGGAVPIVVTGVGVIAAVTVSGMPSAEDHALVVAGIMEFLAG
jgi:uncharacterized protein (UPF0303 family)